MCPFIRTKKFETKVLFVNKGTASEWQCLSFADTKLTLGNGHVKGKVTSVWQWEIIYSYGLDCQWILGYIRQMAAILTEVTVGLSANCKVSIYR